MGKSWSVNLTDGRYDGAVELDSPPLLRLPSGQVGELVFFSPPVGRWIHAVCKKQRARALPAGHVEVDLQDLAWVRQCQMERGPAILPWCCRVIEGRNRGRL